MSGLDKSNLKAGFAKSLIAMQAWDFDFYSEKPSEWDESLGFSVIKIWHEVYVQNIRIYSSISDALLNMNKVGKGDINDYDGDISVIIVNVEKFKKIAPEDNVLGWEEFLDKIIDHIELIRIQMSRIYESTEIAEQLVESSKKQIEEIYSKQKEQQKKMEEQSETIQKEQQEKLENQKSEFTNLQSKQKKELEEQRKKSDDLEKQQLVIIDSSKNIQKEFIAILGIFASILIATFGGLTSLSSLFAKINKVATYKLVFIGSFEVLAILMIIFLMLNGVSKLTGLNLRSCGCEQDCNCKIHKKHPTLFMLTILTLLLSFISLAPLISKFINNWSTDSSSLVTFSVYFMVVLVAVITIVITWFEVHSQEEIKEE